VQLRNRAKVLAAARAEFAEHGYRDATIDRIAARADLTRGAVYSNFPGKRALYFSTLVDGGSPTTGVRDTRGGPGADGGPGDGGPGAGGPGAGGPGAGGPGAGGPGGRAVVRHAATADGLSAFASAWLDQQHPGPDVLTELGDVGTAYAGLLELNAVLLGLSLDRSAPGDLGRMIRIARLALTLLTGASQLTSAPGFVQPLDVARACAHLSGLDLDDPWIPPPTSPPIRPAEEPWSPPSVIDEVRHRPADLDSPGVIAVLGLNRLSAAEDVVRSARGTITIALVSSHPDELGPLARYTTGSLLSCLQQSFPRVQLVHDESGVLASALGCEVIGDDLEYAAAIADGRILSRAVGFGGAYAVAGR
jgi:AcrR family transcriptional regulator